MTGWERLELASAIFAAAWFAHPEWVPVAAILWLVALVTTGRSPNTNLQAQDAHRVTKPRGGSRWRLGIGLGLTTLGPLPFITLYRRGGPR